VDRVLVTGGAGFIRSNFVRYLLNQTKCAAINLYKLTYAGNLNNIKDLRSEKRHKFTSAGFPNYPSMRAFRRRSAGTRPTSRGGVDWSAEGRRRQFKNSQ